MKKRVKKLKKSSFLQGPFHKTKIRIIGIGGGGSSIVSDIAKDPVLFKKSGIDFWAANTDLQALKKTTKKIKIFQFGQDLTKGLGCGMNTKLGEKAAQNKEEKIKKILKGADLCVLVACLGGGTSSGAGPVFVDISQKIKNINFGFFTLPFKFEGKKKGKIAKDSLFKLKPNLNAFVVFPNEKIFKIIDKKTPIRKAFSDLNSILAENLKSLIEVIYQPGLINIDWADLKAILTGRQKIAYLAMGQAQGENRAKEALKQVLESPFCQYSMDGFLVERILFNISGSKNLEMSEVEEISKTISNFNKRAKIIFGLSQSEALKNKIKITLLAVGRPRKDISSIKSKERKIRSAPTFHKKKAGVKKSEKISFKTKIKTKKKIASPSSFIGTAEDKKVINKKEEKRLKKKTKKSKKFKKPKTSKKSKIKAKNIRISSKPRARINLAWGKETGQNKIKVKVRKNALQIKKEMEKEEKEILEKEKKWEIPAFLRKNK